MSWQAVWNTIRIAASVIAAILGGWDVLLEVLVVLVLLDYVTGVLEAWENKTLNSSIGLRGILKKVGYFLAVIVAVELDKILIQAAPPGVDALANLLPARTLVITFLLANEGLSVLEHLAALGVPIPKFLKDALEALRQPSSGQAAG